MDHNNGVHSSHVGCEGHAGLLNIAAGLNRVTKPCRQHRALSVHVGPALSQLG